MTAALQPGGSHIARLTVRAPCNICCRFTAELRLRKRCIVPACDAGDPVATLLHARHVASVLLLVGWPGIVHGPPHAGSYSCATEMLLYEVEESLESPSDAECVLTLRRTGPTTTTTMLATLAASGRDPPALCSRLTALGWAMCPGGYPAGPWGACLPYPTPRATPASPPQPMRARWTLLAG